MQFFLFFVVAFIGAVLSEVQETATNIEPHRPVSNCGRQNFTDNPRGLGKYPWLVKLLYKYPKISRCGGVLVADQWVLSSAACLRSNQLHAVMLGEYDTTNAWDCICIDDKDIIQRFLVETKIFNDKYDVGLLKLLTPVRINEYVSPMCIPLIDDYILPNVIGRVSGWSYLDGRKQLYNEALQSTNMIIINNTVCDQILNTTIPSYKFCAKRIGKPIPCVPMPGGPFMEYWERNGDGRFYAGGIMLQEASECDTKKPIVFLDTRHVQDWITNIITDCMFNKTCYNSAGF